MGYLPLDKYRVQTIGASAFENANISDVRLPSTLRSVGEKAFAGNHIPYLELPNNAALDTCASTRSSPATASPSPT